MERYIIQNRNKWYPYTTIGEILIDNKHYCYTLEDIVRPYGIKIDKFTAIPFMPAETGGYKVAIRYSPKFEKNVLVLYTDIINGKYVIKAGGIMFVNVEIHGGNTIKDTDGCVLVAKNRAGNKIYGSMQDDIFALVSEWIKAGDNIHWIINNVHTK